MRSCLGVRGRRYTGRGSGHPPAGAPVHALGPVQEPVVDQVSAQGRVVRVVTGQQGVDLGFGVAGPRFEVEGDALQDNQTLAVGGGNLD